MYAYFVTTKGYTMNARVIDPSNGQWYTGSTWSATEASAQAQALSSRDLANGVDAVYYGTITVPAGNSLLVEYVDTATGDVLAYDDAVPPAVAGDAMTLHADYDAAKTAAQAGDAMTLHADYDAAKTASQAGDPMTLTGTYDAAITAAQAGDAMTLTAAYDAAMTASQTGDKMQLIDAYFDSNSLLKVSALSSGMITSAVDVSPELIANFPKIIMEKGERRTVRIWVLENGTAKDCTGMTFKFGVKSAVSSTTYKLGPYDGTLGLDDNAVNSIVTFIIPPDDTKDMTPFTGYYSVVSFDSGGNKLPLSSRTGVKFQLVNDIVDVHGDAHATGEASAAAGGTSTAEVT